MSSSLEGKVAIVTGSAGGLGKVIAQHLLLAGAHVVLCDFNETALETTYNELKTHGKCITIKLDVSSSSSVQELFEKTISHLGKIDILVNNAGIMDKFDGAADCEEDLWNQGPGSQSNWTLSDHETGCKTLSGTRQSRNNPEHLFFGRSSRSSSRCSLYSKQTWSSWADKKYGCSLCRQ